MRFKNFMRFKKTLIIGAILGLVSLPLIANATELDVNNQTDLTSSVKILSNPKYPSGWCSAPTYVTGPKSVGKFQAVIVQALCNSNPCVANIYAASPSSCDDSALVGTASINTSNDIVTITSVAPGHTLSGSGTSTITID